jgi:hypothetical protein
MKETWKFNVDLTYEHTTERYEGGITTGPFFQSSYSRPTRIVNVAFGLRRIGYAISSIYS